MSKFNVNIIKNGTINESTTNQSFVESQITMRALTSRKDTIQDGIKKLETKAKEEDLTDNEQVMLVKLQEELRQLDVTIKLSCINGVTENSYDTLASADKMIISLLAMLENKSTPVPLIEIKSLYIALNYHMNITDGLELEITEEMKKSFADVRAELTAVLVGIQEKMFDCNFFNPVKLRVNVGVTNNFIAFMRKGYAPNKDGNVVVAKMSEKQMLANFKFYVVSLLQANIIEFIEPKTDNTDSTEKTRLESLMKLDTEIEERLKVEPTKKPRNKKAANK